MTRMCSLGAMLLTIAACTAGLTGCPTGPTEGRYTYRVVNTYSHDPSAFTQGLVYADGIFYESTGMYGESTVRQVEVETGTVLKQRSLAANYFGEGLALYEGKLYQLTWQARKGFVYDKTTLEPDTEHPEFSYTTEGWGLTFDGKDFILSDGSSYLRFIDPAQGFERPIRAVQVRDDNGPVTKLNELEYIDGEIYANVWGSDFIARIAPDTGRVIDWIDLTGLLPDDERQGPEAVLNGIAYDAEGGRLFVTGKYWPHLYEIEVVPQQ